MSHICLNMHGASSLIAAVRKENLTGSDYSIFNVFLFLQKKIPFMHMMLAPALFTLWDVNY